MTDLPLFTGVDNSDAIASKKVKVEYLKYRVLDWIRLKEKVRISQILMRVSFSHQTTNRQVPNPVYH